MPRLNYKLRSVIKETKFRKNELETVDQLVLGLSALCVSYMVLDYFFRPRRTGCLPRTFSHAAKRVPVSELIFRPTGTADLGQVKPRAAN